MALSATSHGAAGILISMSHRVIEAEPWIRYAAGVSTRLWGVTLTFVLLDSWMHWIDTNLLVSCV